MKDPPAKKPRLLPERKPKDEQEKKQAGRKRRSPTPTLTIESSGSEKEVEDSDEESVMMSESQHEKEAVLGSVRAAGSSTSSPDRELHSFSTTPIWKSFIQNGCERIDIIVDSGASVCMMPDTIAKNHPIEETARRRPS